MANFALGNRDGAIEQMRRSEELLSALRSEHPDVPMYREEWSIAASTLGEMHALAEKPAEAMAIFNAALVDYPDSLVLCNEAARFFATYPDPQVRQPDRALQLASHATQLAPRDAGAWSVLGIAYYRAAQWQAAVEALQKSMELRDGGEAWDWFYLAMANWQLGQPEEARKWYAQGTDWARTPRNLRQVRLLYQEAASVLGEPAPEVK